MNREAPINPNRGDDLDAAGRKLNAALIELEQQYYGDYPAGVAEVVEAARALLDVGEFFCPECGSIVPGALFSPDAFSVSPAGTAERCDQCERFDGDLDAALAVAEKLGKQAWFIRHDHTTGERRVTLVTAALVAESGEGWSIESQTDPWVGDPDAGYDLTDDEGQPITVLPPVASPERAGDV